MPLLSRRSVPYEDRDDPAAVAEWIKAHVPCPVGGYQNTSLTTRERVFDTLRPQVPAPVALAAMRAVFGPRVRVERPPGQEQPAFRQPSAAANDFGPTFAWWEHRFTIAELGDDLETMNDIVQAVVELLYHLAGGERKEFERARRAMQANARSISPVVQHLTREELRRLRAAPTPSDFSRLRINPRRNQQRQAARRRAR